MGVFSVDVSTSPPQETIHHHTGLSDFHVNTHDQEKHMNDTFGNSQFDPNVLKDFPGVKAVYELRRTLDLEVHQTSVRIEVWYWHSNPNSPWVTKVHTRGKRPDRWKEWPDFPWVEERDEATAIHQALAFIEER